MTPWNGDFFTEEGYRKHQLIRLAPYYPILNTIDHVWSWLKGYVKRELKNREDVPNGYFSCFSMMRFLLSNTHFLVLFNEYVGISPTMYQGIYGSGGHL